MIDVKPIYVALAVMAAILLCYFLWRMIRMVFLEKWTARRAEFYANYEPPKGQDAVNARKEIEAMIAADPDYAGLNHHQRRALAANVDRTMRKRANNAKRQAV